VKRPGGLTAHIEILVVLLAFALSAYLIVPVSYGDAPLVQIVAQTG
jgi:hypothetical protein